MQQNLEKDVLSFLVDLAVHHFVWVALGIYSSGFFIWNYYLSYYSFFEYNFIQTRFLSAGLLIWLPVVFVVILTTQTLKIIPEKHKFSRKLIDISTPIFFVIWFSSLFALFPQLPQVLGGGETNTTKYYWDARAD